MIEVIFTLQIQDLSDKGARSASPQKENNERTRSGKRLYLLD